MQRILKWLTTIAGFLLDNVVVLLTAGFAGYIIYRQGVAHLAVPIEDLITAVLWVLGLLAVSEIVERYRVLNRIATSSGRTLSLLEGHSADRPSAIAFFQRIPVLDSFVQSADYIDMCGVTLTSTINKQYGNLRDRLAQGANIRLLVANPDSLALDMSSLRSEAPEDVDYYGKRLEATLKDIEYLHKSWIEFQKRDKALQSGTLAVRLLPYAPSFGILAFNAPLVNGIVFVEVYAHKGGFKSPPMFALTSQRDGTWYEYFVTQFEEMWEKAKLWTP